MSPYIVTTKRGDPPFPNNPAILSRCAVATLSNLSPVGPLPDGTVIEAEATTWSALAVKAIEPTLQAALIAAANGGDALAQQRICDAYDARQAP
jgi:replication-associated recombination protein RarA